MSPSSATPRYRVLPLPRVQREAKKLLSKTQLREAIRLTKRLRYFPQIPELSVEPCGLGMELRIEHPVIGQQGWLRAIFWVHEAKRTIYVTDVFWKKTSKIPIADRARSDHRIRQLKLLLGGGNNPWKGSGF
jgi:phage-related protein